MAAAAAVTAEVYGGSQGVAVFNLEPTTAAAAAAVSSQQLA